MSNIRRQRNIVKPYVDKKLRMGGRSYTIIYLLLFLLGKEIVGTDQVIEGLVSDYLEFWSRRGGITSAGVDLLMRRNNTACHEFQRFEFKQGKLQLVPNPMCVGRSFDKFSTLIHSHFFRFFKKCQFTTEDPAFQFVVNTKDEPNQPKVQVEKLFENSGILEAPLMSFQSTVDHIDVPIDYSRDDQKLEDFVKMTMLHANSTDWDSKIPILFWRGSQTGGWYTVKNWKTFPRSKLVMFSKVTDFTPIYFFDNLHIHITK